MAEQLQDIFKKNQYDLKVAAKNSKNWFQQQTLLLTKQRITPANIIKSDASKLKAAIVPGSLYMFLYDPKHKETLEYYDRFPLVFPYEKTPDGFMGLNMHYLPYQPRILLLQRLMNFATNKQMNENTRINYSWGLIRGVSKFQWAEPCLKHYLKDHLRSSLRKVEPMDWATAMLLPVEQFVGANKAAVWANSMR
jgi:hypothetical protein